MRNTLLLPALLVVVGSQKAFGLSCFQGQQSSSVLVNGTPTMCAATSSACLLVVDGTIGMATRSCLTTNCTLNGVQSSVGFCQGGSGGFSINSTYCCCYGDGCNRDMNSLLAAITSPPLSSSTPTASPPTGSTTPYTPPVYRRCYQSSTRSGTSPFDLTAFACPLGSNSCALMVDATANTTTRGCRMGGCNFNGVPNHPGFCQFFNNSMFVGNYCCCSRDGCNYNEQTIPLPNGTLPTAR
ncbi:hypothetical protein M3Y99_01487700 [Aphelenchoides fujianensis]|nr:hypothetical protein M3Y99_01487700 [Aphelenchoides fujianensis]